MDRRAIAGFVFIGLILMIWMWVNAPPPQKPGAPPDTTRAQHPVTDTVRVAAPPPQQARPADSLGKFFSGLAAGRTDIVHVETPLFRARLSSQGGNVRSWVLQHFKTWNQYPADLIPDSTGGEFNLIFLTADGRLINTKHLFFQTTAPAGGTLTLGEHDSATVRYVLPVTPRSRIEKDLTFYGDRYSFEAKYTFVAMDSIIANYEYQVTWEDGLRYLEDNTVNESNFAKASAFAGGEITDVDASNFGEVYKQNVSGRVNWVAARNKYFAAAILPREKESQGALIEGSRSHLPDNGARETYSLALTMPYLGKPVETDRYTVFVGPLDFDIVKTYNVELERIMSLGSAWVIRPISEYIILPVFKFLRLFISNYGVILIIFALIIKVVLYPLTKSSMTSMRKMQKLQPMMDEIRTKYKEDPQKMNQQVMRLYKEYGVNPAGGCLPMLLQLPILYALWAVFSATIELRQAAFIGWIKDLSTPDVIATLPFRLPIVNIDQISGLALLMGVTMFVQQKMSVKDPRQKMMVWMMPVMLTLLFNGFPSGLNLYYFVFNLLSIAQQAYVNKTHKDEPLKKVEDKKKRGGIFAKFSENMPKLNR